MINKTVHIQDLGTKDYQETWDYQTALLQEIVELKIANRKEQTDLQTANHFLFVENTHVYTLGKRGDISNLLLNEEQLSCKRSNFLQNKPRRRYNLSWPRTNCWVSNFRFRKFLYRHS